MRQASTTGQTRPVRFGVPRLLPVLSAARLAAWARLTGAATPRRLLAGRLALLLLAALAAGGCRFEKQISGRVVDFDSGQPLPGAEVTASQTGWGISGGGIVWDKTHVTRTRTDADGRFRLHYRVGDSARTEVALAGYQRYRSWYAPGMQVLVRLRRLIEDYRPLPQGYLRIGQRVDGSYYGWNFARAGLADAAEADIIPGLVEPSVRGVMRLGAPAPGGIRYLGADSLGVDARYLSYTDTAPASGYRRSVKLDFGAAGGVLFVRTRAGRYAKIEFDPAAFFMESAPDIARDLTLRYVYNPDGSRDLRFQEADSYQ